MLVYIDSLDCSLEKKVRQTLQFWIWLGYKHENSALLSQLLPSVQHYFLFLTRPLRPVLWSCTLFENDSKCRIWILAFFNIFCPFTINLSGNTVGLLKCKRSSLRSQCWIRLFLDFHTPWSLLVQILLCLNWMYFKTIFEASLWFHKTRFNICQADFEINPAFRSLGNSCCF